MTMVREFGSGLLPIVSRPISRAEAGRNGQFAPQIDQPVDAGQNTLWKIDGYPLVDPINPSGSDVSNVFLWFSRLPYGPFASVL